MSNTPSDPQAETHYLNGQAEFAKGSRVGTAEAIKEFTKVTEIEQNFARGHTWLGYAILENYKQNWDDAAKSLRLANEEILTGVRLDPDDYFTHWTLASFYMEIKKGSRIEYEIALTLNPNDADLLAGFSDWHSFEGNPSDAIALIEEAKSRKANTNIPYWYPWSLGLAHFQARNYEEAIEAFVSMPILPNEAYLMLVISKAKKDPPELTPIGEIKTQLETMDPNWSNEHLDRMPFAKPEDQAHWLDGLRTVGLLP